jgi:hypothetical protein
MLGGNMDRRKFLKAGTTAGIVAAIGSSALAEVAASPRVPCVGIRVAGQAPNSSAVEAANASLGRAASMEASTEGVPKWLSLQTRHEADLRALWMNEYVKAGGQVQEICGDRVATVKSDPVISQITDRVFYARHPELQNTTLSFACPKGALRQEWMDIYVQYGGSVRTICSPRAV